MDAQNYAPAKVVDVQTSGVSWAAVAAGAGTSAALSLALIALGSGLGLSSVSPWSGSGVSGTTFEIGAAVYLLLVAMMASSVGGYLAARLRTRGHAIHDDETFFRDTAHGLITWAVATLISVMALASATSTIAGGATEAAFGGARAIGSGPVGLGTDTLFRADPSRSAAPQPDADAARAEISRLLTASLQGGDVSVDDRTYISRVVAAQTGLSQADADKRVGDVITSTKQAMETARKAGARWALWITASLLLGAFASCLAAAEGGALRDGTWNNKRVTPALR